MPTELIVAVKDEPGMLASVGELFGEQEINIAAAAAFTHQGKGYLHFVVDDADRAVGVLKENGYEVDEIREVVSVTLDDQPGELGRYARNLANAGVNILSFYTGGSKGGDTEVILAVDDVESVRGH